MKVYRPFKISCFSLLFLTLSCATAFSDFDAGQFAIDFNRLNNGQGFRYNYTTANGSHIGTGSEIQLSNQAGATPVDFSAYRPDLYTGGGNYMRTFCIEPNNSLLAYSGTADLNYQNGQTRTSSGGVVKLGTAALYSQFASGALQGFNFTAVDRHAEYITLRAAIQATMGLISADWSANKYLSQLLTLNSDKSYWSATYDPGMYYREVGNYAVFAMNVYNNSGGDTQDFLYVTKADYGNGGNDVPEPATILFWSLGTLGFVGASRRRRNCKKNKRLLHG